MVKDTLSDAHAALIESSAITREVASAAGVRTATEIPPEFAGHPLASVPALVFPWRRPGGEIVSQLRPDYPLASRDGRPVKYLFPAGTVPVLNVHPAMAARVADVSAPLLIVEGTKQYLAAVSHLDGASIAAVGISGCRGWLYDGAPIPDLAGVPWEGRAVIIALDADARTNRDVWDGADGLAEMAIAYGAADVRHLKVPGTGKAGLDDVLARSPDPAAMLGRLIGSAGKLPRQPAAKNGRVAPNAATAATSEPSLTCEVAAVAPVAPPMDGAALLDETIRAITAYIAFRDPLYAVAVTLYAAATHAVRELQVAPRLRVKSPVMRCGKSRLLDVLLCLVRRPFPTANASAASVARSIGKDPCTLLMDEQDTVFGRDARSERAEDLRGILNSGFTRRFPYTRYNASTGQVESWPTFAMAILAGIGDLPDTIEDRAVIIPMARKIAGRDAAKFRDRRDVPALQNLGARLAAWIEPLAAQIGTAEPAMPAGMSDRAEDTWEPLIAVADMAGGHWPDLARDAARVMAAEAATADAEKNTDARLLADLLTVFGNAHAMHTHMILAKLAGLDGAPWGDYDHGRPLNPSQLADKLRPFGIHPRDVKIDGVNRKGYYRADFSDAASRYLAAPPVGGATPATPATSQVNEGVQVAAVADGAATSGPLPVHAPYLAPPPPNLPAQYAAPSGMSAEHAERMAALLGEQVATDGR